jgi:hypothetical protein
MARLPRLLVPLAALVVVGVCALPASAGRPTQWDHTLTTAHFVVHYHTDVSGADYATETDAGDFASFAEQAYETYLSWGYPAPPVSPDGHIDIYVEDLSTDGVVSEAAPDTNGPAGGTAWFDIASPAQIQGFADTDSVSLTQEEQEAVAANVFYMFEAGEWIPSAANGDLWLLYGPGTWAALNSMPFAPTFSIGNPDIALNCSETKGTGYQMCDPNFYDDAGFARYTFFGLLASKWGNSFLNSVFANGAAGETSTDALSNAIAAKGTTLAAVYNDYVNRYMSGTLGPTSLDSVRAPTYTDVTVGASSITPATPAAVVPVNHLSARFVTFQRGDGDGSHACYAAKLTVNVALQVGAASASLSSISSQPDFFWDVPGSSPQPLDVNGSNASITVPWDTCDWGATRGWVSLPNASASVDGATFTVTDSVSVDTTTPASPTSAPAQTSVWGTTVPVPTNDVAPAITVYGPELLQVSSSDPSIRLIVESDGPGTLNAALGAAALGQRILRAGNNDLRYIVPKSLLNSLRTSAVAGNLLTLTPLSPTGAVTGQAVTRHVVIASVKKPVAKKKKPAPKKKPKK